MFKRFNSLQATLLLHELSFVVLIVVTLTVGILWSFSWQQSSEESLRLSSMNTSMQNVRGELYRQLKEVFDSTFLQDSDAINEYQSYTKSIHQHLHHLKSYAVDTAELEAIESLKVAYLSLYQKTVVLFNQKQVDNEHRQLLNYGLENQTLNQLELTFSRLESVLKNKQEQIVLSRKNWSTTLIWLVPIPIILAMLLLLTARRFVRNNIVYPLTTLTVDARLISKGELEHKLPLTGVSELSRLSQAINDMSGELAQNRDALVETKKQAAMAELIPLVAHNIRNPLAGIRAASQVAREEETTSFTRDTLTDIMVAVDRLEHWVTSLLSYLHPVKPNLSQTTLIDVTDSALSMISLQLLDKAISIEKEGWSTDTLKVNLDIHLFEQAVFNLIQNALEASPASGLISLQYVQSAETVELAIANQGKKMRFDLISEQVVNGDSKRLSCGLGIPFAIKIIKQHGGSLNYQNSEGSATVAIIRLPISS